ncbi:MAG TPA: peptidoglycan-binding protein [Cyanobacteria bacterium UBA11369]|nr:peptidoglycan-binding protein [Cyanobacteria bacterium UBA11371]HBE34279.1 peptidoglycan-binding protein [Cyanobacteria bacterium UBA11368]HBE53101.1 peptidoglycan-binding protein [Cyanobacteria bacterium UBA11369]
METAQANQPVLRLGSTGPAVKELQKLLKQRVPIVSNLEVDGIFGEVTKLAVEVFEYRVFLKRDGIVDAKTWKALYAGKRDDLPVLRRGSRGDDVARVQDVLKFSVITAEYMGFDGYYFGVVDGDFGAKTEAAVKAFQKDRDLVVDGVIGAKTWQALMELAAMISHIGF